MTDELDTPQGTEGASEAISDVQAISNALASDPAGIAGEDTKAAPKEKAQADPDDDPDIDPDAVLDLDGDELDEEVGEFGVGCVGRIRLSRRHHRGRQRLAMGRERMPPGGEFV